MGSFWENSNKTRNEVLEDIEALNKITNSEPFRLKTKSNLKFTLDDGSVFNRNSRKIIKCEITSENNQNQKPKKKYILIDDFYKFFDLTILNSQIFLNEKLKNNINNNNINKENKEDEITDDGNDICSICENNKVSVMLDCYHFFCEDCIKTWLIKKKSNCPLCRLNIDPNTNKLNEKYQWDIIDEKFDQKEYDRELNNKFIYLYNKLFK
jgi:hypothetical protein